jgi:hypothetical protein
MWPSAFNGRICWICSRLTVPLRRPSFFPSLGHFESWRLPALLLLRDEKFWGSLEAALIIVRGWSAETGEIQLGLTTRNQPKDFGRVVELSDQFGFVFEVVRNKSNFLVLLLAVVEVTRILRRPGSWHYFDQRHKF